VRTVVGSRPRGRLRGLVAVGGAMVALAGCSDTSFNAQTNAVYDAGAGTNSRGGGVDVLNLLVVDNGDGTGTVSATLVLNPGAYELDEVPSSVTLDGLEVTTLDDEEVSSNLAPGVTLEPNDPVRLGDEPVATVSGDNAVAGDMVNVRITFDGDAETVELDAPVVERTEMYDDVAEAS
jgi:hypothetical protein